MNWLAFGWTIEVILTCWSFLMLSLTPKSDLEQRFTTGCFVAAVLLGAVLAGLSL